jgi:LacI family repressor for deo operon, udp, cdd, tsx, nupC, and nupG
MHDIAKKAGVSSATVSRVLNNKAASIPISLKTREKVLALAKKMGYSPNLMAKSLRTKRTYLVGVVLWDLTDPFFSEILRGIEQVLDESGYNLLLTTAEANKERELGCLEKMRHFRTDGILIVGGAESFGEKKIKELGIDTRTLVLIGTRSEGADVRSITVDNISGGYIGAEYLIKRGCRSLVYIAGREKTIDMEDRLEGVQQAIKTYDFLHRSIIIEQGSGEEHGYKAAAKVLKNLELPAAIFGVNDLTALGILRAAKDHNLRVPEDVAVLGFDDLSMASYLEPRLSTVHQPRLQLGRNGAELLLKLMAKQGDGSIEKHQSRVLNPKLVIRESA